MTLLLSPWNHLTLIALKLDGLDKDIAYKVATLKQEEVALFSWCVVDFYILPFCRKRNFRTSFCTIGCAMGTHFGVQLTSLRALYGDSHLVGLTFLCYDVFHRSNLYIPPVFACLCCMDIQAICCVIFKRISKIFLIRFPADRLTRTEILARNLCIHLFRTGVWLVANKLCQPSYRLLRMPSEGVTIDTESCLGSGLHIVLHGFKVHIAIAIHATCHLHGITGNGLREVLVGHVIDRRFLKILRNGCACTKFEIRILGIVNIIFESLILV